MLEYRVDKIRCSVTVLLRDGRTLVGEVFLQERARFRNGPENPADLLNSAEAFFPLACGDGGLVLIAKDQVVRMESEPTEDTFELDVPRDGIDVEVRLADGSAAAGKVFPAMPAEKRRLLDFFNSDHDRFMAVTSPSKVHLVNRQMITSVRQLD